MKLDTSALRAITGNKFDVQQLNGAGDITLALCVKVSYLERTVAQNEHEFFKKFIDNLEEAIKDTRTYKDAIANTTHEIDFLRKKIDDLQQYKTYYELHYQMQNKEKIK